MIYAGRGVSYVDALFFATGACTQAGLNTIDVNLLNTWQQVNLIVIKGSLINVVLDLLVVHDV